MEPGVVKIADDSDFDMLKMLVDDHANWRLEYDKGDDTKVSTNFVCIIAICCRLAVELL